MKFPDKNSKLTFYTNVAIGPSNKGTLINNTPPKACNASKVAG